MRDANHLRQEAARAIRFSQQAFDPLTRERLHGLAADYLTQAIELESGGQTVPPHTDPTE
jgi:hypothetical protein